MISGANQEVVYNMLKDFVENKNKCWRTFKHTSMANTQVNP